ncbi:MAG: hypothetical protein HY276_01965 [Ignavibacteriales bacterium]|nr:hypothetical protein [Ignavibacteriales bacterium]
MNSTTIKDYSMREKCDVCDRPPKGKFAKYCAEGCGKLISRANGGKKEEKEARRKAVRGAWVQGAFRCHYSFVELELFDSSSPFYFTFDHATPRNSHEIVACAQFLNDMKSDTTENEFKNNVIKLAHYFKTGEKLSWSDFELKHFSRNHTKKK